MANTIKYEAVATIGEYKDRNGETKKRYVNIGKVFENDKGQLSLKLDTIPVDPNWSGWVSFYEPKERQEPGRTVLPKPSANPPKNGSGWIDDDDMPPF